jgi:predicted P-loop ATPase
MSSATKAEMQVHGTPLQERHYAALAARWISREYADGAYLRYADSALGADLVGQDGIRDYSGILIPYFVPGQPSVREYRLRRDNPELTYSPDGKPKPQRKYLSPPGRSNLLYIPVGVELGWLSDTTLPVVLTEGEFKTIALYRLAWHAAGDAAERPAFLPLGLQGVWNWRGTIGKTENANGKRVDVTGPIADLGRINWQGRAATITFDSDAPTNYSVRIARSWLTDELETRSAILSWFEFPANNPEDCKGIDDLLAAIGPDPVLRLLAKARLKTRKKGGTAAVPVTGWQANLLRTDRGQIRRVVANAIMALQTAPEWQGVLSYDAFKLFVVTQRPTPWNEERLIWSDADDIRLADWLQMEGIDVPPRVAGEAVQVVARERQVHPVRDYLNHLRWDGSRRLDTWLETYLGANSDGASEAYLSAVGSRFLISAVARVMEPGCKVDHCLILEGPQGIGKSTALKTLAGDWFTDEIADIGSKDCSMQVSGVWIVELSELDAMTKAEIGRVKAFLTRSVDRYRPPYGRSVSDVPRQCVFAGTVNNSEYLRDETGARRFWPVACGQPDIEALRRDRDQLWAEAVERYRSSEAWWLDTQALIAEASIEQAARYQGDVWQELIEKKIKPKDSVSIHEVLGELGLPVDRQGQAEANRVARSLRTAGWVRRRVGSRRSRSWRYFPPAENANE